MMTPNQKLDITKTQWKVAKYEPTIAGILEDFEDSVFGYFYNRRTLECFIDKLTEEGWKYFNVHNLNEMFSIFLEKYGTCDPDSTPAKVKPKKDDASIAHEKPKASEQKTEKKLVGAGIVLEPLTSPVQNLRAPEETGKSGERKSYKLHSTSG